MVLIQRKLYVLFKGSRGGPEFSRGRGSNFFLMIISKEISIETHITCDFPRDPDPLSPLWSQRFHRIFIGRISW